MRMSIPIGIKASDCFFEMLAGLSGHKMSEHYACERGRLLDAYADGNKYVYGKQVALFGDEDLVAALMLWCTEIGMKPVVVTTGRGSKRLWEELTKNSADVMLDDVTLCDDADFDTIDSMMQTQNIDLCIGTSKGYRLARARGIPLVRVGFPVHDRFGAARIATCCYQGTLTLMIALSMRCLKRRRLKVPWVTVICKEALWKIIPVLIRARPPCIAAFIYRLHPLAIFSAGSAIVATIAPGS